LLDSLLQEIYMNRNSTRITKTPKIWADYVRSDREDLFDPIKKSNKRVNKEILTCGVCDETFRSKYQLESHIKELHRPNIKPFIQTKTKSVNISKEYTCSSCDAKFSSHKILLNHKKSCANKLVDTQKSHELKACFLCSNSYKNQSSLNRHIKDFHGNRRKFHCLYCSKAYDRKYQLKNHVMSVHDVLIIQQEGDSKFTLKVQDPKKDYVVSMHRVGNEDMIKIDGTSTKLTNFTSYFDATICDTIEVNNFIGADSGTECLVVCKKNGDIIAKDKSIIMRN